MNTPENIHAPQNSLVQAAPYTSQAIAAYDPYANQIVDNEIDFRDIVRILRKHKGIIAAFTVFVLITVIVGTMLLRPTYKATTMLEVKPSSSSVIEFDNVKETGVQLSKFVATQVEILQSDTIARAAIQNAGLINEPELNGKIRQRGFLIGLKQIFFTLNVGGFVKTLIGLDSGSGEMQNPEESEKEELEKEERVERITDQRRIGILSSKLSIDPVRSSNIFKISFESFSPKLAANVANSIAQEYIELSNKKRFGSTSDSKEFLGEEIKRIQARLETSEKELTEFARVNQIVDVEDRDNIMTTKLATLSQQLTQVQAQRMLAQAKNEQGSKGATDTLSIVLQEPLIIALKRERARVQSEYNKLSRVYKENYPSLRQVKAELDQIDSSISRETGRIVSSLQSDFEQLQQQEIQLQKSLDLQKSTLLGLQDRAVQYNILKREWESNKELYKGLLGRMKELSVAGGMELNNITIIDPAVIPVGPSGPRILLNTMIAGILGLFGGIGFAFLLAYLDNSFRNPEELERAVGLPSLGIIPRIDGDNVSINILDKITELNRNSGIAEAIRNMRTSLSFSLTGGMPKTLVITSSSSAEGKSTIASNLAIALVQNGARVLLLDCDLRKPRQHKNFKCALSPGLTEHLVGVRHRHINSAETLINFSSMLHKPDILCSGTIPPNPAELLSSPKFDELIEELKLEYDHIVIDAPPVLGLADALIISSKVDAVALVVSAGEVGRDAVRESVKRLRSIRAPLIGVVLNGVDINSSEYSYYTRYYYGNEKEKNSGESIAAQTG